MRIARKGFLKGSLSLLGFAALRGGRIFAAPPGWKPGKTPRLVFGVLSDTHFRCDNEWRSGVKSNKFFVAALEYFRERNVDAVVHCGDMADRGLVEELQLHADAWNSVFPQNKAPDGHVVEKLFVSGNHDAIGWNEDMNWAKFVPRKSEWTEKILKMDFARHWERIWGEKYEPVWHRRVKGVDFFGMNWIENSNGEGEARLLQLMDDEPPAPGPFFFVTHERTHGRFNAAVKRHPGGFGLWGHWHLSAANWKTIHMLNRETPGVQCPACPSWWRPDGKWMGGGDSDIAEVPIEGKLLGGRWEQGLVIGVYDDMIVIERREFSQGGSLGADWVMPFGRSPHPFSKGELRKKIGKPQFREGAELEVVNVANVKMPPIADIQSRLGTGNIAIKIPPADGNPDSRVYAYEVVVAAENGTQKLHKAVYASGCNMGIGHESDGGVTTLEIPCAEIASVIPGPQSVATVAVRPLSSLGTKGAAIAKEIKLA